MRGERSRRTLGFCGRIGNGDSVRVDAMSDLLGGVRSLVDRQSGSMRADAGAARWSVGAATAVSWSPAPLPDTLPQDASSIAERHDAFSLVVDGSGAYAHTGISGAVPVYVDAEATAGNGLAFCSRVEPLVRTRGRAVRPDWDAWAHILAAGGPLEGRTTFDGVHRLGPWSRVTVENGSAPVVATDGWPWLDVPGAADASAGAVWEALVAVVGGLAERTSVSSLLSGGWDSRILAALAAGAAPDPVAWTTSSDTGTVLEELVAAKVATRLRMRHKLVPARRDQLAGDFDWFTRSVDYQTSSHVWLVPLARELLGSTATVLDGLGGGLFVGGAFPDDGTDRPVVDSRFDRLTRSLEGAEKILDPRVVAQLRERTRAGFEKVAGPLAGHPFGSTFTAYLTQTLPGISLAPYGLIGGSAPVATPFLDNDVVRAALAIPHEQHSGGRLYPELLRPADADLAELPTALDLTPRERRHPRRVTSPEAARRFRELLTRDPIRQLLAPGLATAELEVWRAHLDQTRPQHLIRGLATLALWMERYADLLGGIGVDELLERG